MNTVTCPSGQVTYIATLNTATCPSGQLTYIATMNTVTCHSGQVTYISTMNTVACPSGQVTYISTMNTVSCPSRRLDNNISVISRYWYFDGMFTYIICPRVDTLQFVFCLFTLPADTTSVYQV
jgi:hypothetical protein